MSLDSSENQVKIKCSLNIIVMIYWVIVLVIMTIYNDKLDRYIPNIDTKSQSGVRWSPVSILITDKSWS